MQDFDRGRATVEDMTPITSTVYERRTLSGPGGRYYVFVLQGVSDTDMLLQLLDGYRKQGG
jgi:hypothetical protein